MAFVPRRKVPRFHGEWIGPQPPLLSRTGEGDQTVWGCTQSTAISIAFGLVVADK